MQKYFSSDFSSSPLPPPPPLVSSLEGPHVCDYCGGKHAQQFRFQILVPDQQQRELVGKGSFCTPECAAAHNRYKSINANTDQCAARHQLIERQNGRRVVSAPPLKQLSHLSRNQWIQECRLSLTKEEIEIALTEMVVKPEQRKNEKR